MQQEEGTDVTGTKEGYGPVQMRVFRVVMEIDDTLLS
jgi:hypothetical protein